MIRRDFHRSPPGSPGNEDEALNHGLPHIPNRSTSGHITLLSKVHIDVIQGMLVDPLLFLLYIYRK